MPRCGAMAAAQLIDAGAFDDRMRALGPFETTPHIAVAVSGGPDSLCLAVLTHQWTGANGGQTTGLIVDHGLRPESSDEAARVATQLRALGIDAHVLTWAGAKPRRNIQARARAARYHQLLTWCRTQGVLHLAVGHQALDQTETYLMRQRAGSGPDGLAGMAAVSEHQGVRVIRPLLPLAPERLRETLRAADVSWIDDPSNQDENYTRVGIRRELRAKPSLDALSAARRAAAARRHTAEHIVAEILADAVRLSALGYATLDWGAFRHLPPQTAQRCLARVLQCIGGLDYAPRTAQLEALLTHVLGDRAAEPRTLGGCLVVSRNEHDLIVCREPAAIAQEVQLEEGYDLVWDQRFRLRVRPNEPANRPLSVRRLDDAAWGMLRERFPAAAKALTDSGGPFGLPAPARSSLPMLCDLDGPCALPHLPNQLTRPPDEPHALLISFRPRVSLAGASFAVGGS